MPALAITHEGRVARLTLDRPPLNVIDLDYAAELAGGLELVPARAALIVVQAKGKIFSAGVDVRDHLPDRGAEMIHEFHRVCLKLLEAAVPVIGAVHGAALGGGCELTLVCDLVIASTAATFSQPEIKLGVFPPLAAMALPRMIPPHVASEMLLLGRTLSATEARDLGLVNRLTTPDEFPAAVEALIDELLALSPTSLRLTKQVMSLARRKPDPADISAAERFYVEELMETPDAIEGLSAFLEKREPKWERG